MENKFYWLDNYLKWKNEYNPTNKIVKTIGIFVAAQHLVRSINKN